MFETALTHFQHSVIYIKWSGWWSGPCAWSVIQFISLTLEADLFHNNSEEITLETHNHNCFSCFSLLWCCHGFAAAHLLPMPLEVNNTVKRSTWRSLRCRWSIKKETTAIQLSLFFVNSVIPDDDDDPKQSIWTNLFWSMESECHRNAAYALCSSDRRHAEHSNVCTLTFFTVIHHVLYVQCCWGKWPVSATVYLQPAAAHESPMRLCTSWLPSPAHDGVCLASFVERTAEIN